jgi:hypothetical protein
MANLPQQHNPSDDHEGELDVIEEQPAGEDDMRP